jgi:hypothetical protein
MNSISQVISVYEANAQNKLSAENHQAEFFNSSKNAEKNKKDLKPSDFSAILNKKIEKQKTFMT